MPALALGLLWSWTAAAQFGSLSGPVVGYVVDAKTSDLRPVKGILGSATIGERLDTGISPTFMVTLGPGHAIAVTKDGIEVLTLSVDAARITRLPIPGLSGNASLVSVSLQATTAALYDAGAKQIQVVTGLPKEPRYRSAFPTKGAVGQMAVNDDGTLVVYSVAAVEGDLLYAWSAESGSARFVTTAASVSGIALTQSGDAVVTDRGANEVFAIFDAGGGAVRRLLADVREGVSEPVGIIAYSNRIYVANAGTAGVIVLDQNGHYLKSQSCNCSLSGLAPMRESVFRLTDRMDQTIFLLDASSTEERIVFVPPPLE